MKRGPSVKVICSDCQLIRRNGKLACICTNPKHKQTQGS